MRRLVNKINNNVDQIALYEEDQIEGADVVVVSYGITSRVAQRAIEMARQARHQGRQVSPDHGMAVPGKTNRGNRCRR